MDMQFELFARTEAEKAAERRFDHRYYFTLQPPPDIALQIERWSRRLSKYYGARSETRAERLHVSLHGLLGGSLAEQELLDEALEVGEAIRRPSFEISFDTVQTFARHDDKVGGRPQRPTVLTSAEPSREAQALFGDIRREMQRRGLHVEPASFQPHLTVWYGPQSIGPRLLHRPFRWPVRRFWLVHTMPGLRRPEYLGEWALGS